MKQRVCYNRISVGISGAWLFTNVWCRVPQSTQAEMEQAVESCKAAYRTWSKTTPLARQQIMFK
jgi:acyl-CoA reductase-like NAD-dependent aldehyde dehydrogenase